MKRILVVEWREKEGFGSVQACLQPGDECELISAREVPEDLANFDAVVLLNLLPEQCRSNERIQVLTDFVNNGGGLFAIHDALFPTNGFGGLLSLMGLQYAFATTGMTIENQAQRLLTFVVQSNPDQGQPTFPVRPLPAALNETLHPVILDILPFDVAEEYWVFNTTTDTTILLEAEPGDRLPQLNLAPVGTRERLQRPASIAGARLVNLGRCIFSTIGHFNHTYGHMPPETQANRQFKAFMRNAILWAAKQSHQYHVFISFSTRDGQVFGNAAKETLDRMNVRCFLSSASIETGDYWREAHRRALLCSQETIFLLSKRALANPFTTTEWGTTWFLNKRLSAIVISPTFKGWLQKPVTSAYDQRIPQQLQDPQMKIAHSVEDVQTFVTEIAQRAIGALHTN